MALPTTLAEPTTGVDEEGYRLPRPSSPAPQRNDPKYKGDQAAYRREYKAWSARASRERKHQDFVSEMKVYWNSEAGMAKRAALQAEDDADAAHHKKPRGRAPFADGVACSWDAADGCWRTASGEVHGGSAARAEAKAAFFEAKKKEEAAAQEQRRADCARIDAATQAVLRQSERCSVLGFEHCLTGWVWSREPHGLSEFSTSRRPGARARRPSSEIHACLLLTPRPRPCSDAQHNVYIEPVTVVSRIINSTWIGESHRLHLGRIAPGGDDFRAKLADVAGEKLEGEPGLTWPARSAVMQIRRSAFYWHHAHAIVNEEGCMTPSQFDHHYAEVMNAKVEELCRERQRVVLEYFRQFAFKC